MKQKQAVNQETTLADLGNIEINTNGNNNEQAKDKQNQ